LDKLLNSVCSTLDLRLKKIEMRSRANSKSLQEVNFFEAVLRNKLVQEIAYDEQVMLLGCDRRFFKDMYQKQQALQNEKI